MPTPEMLHYGRAEEVIRQRQEVLQAAYARNPERFVRACPTPRLPPTAAWINPPASPAASRETSEEEDTKLRWQVSQNR